MHQKELPKTKGHRIKEKSFSEDMWENKAQCLPLPFYVLKVAKMTHT